MRVAVVSSSWLFHDGVGNTLRDMVAACTAWGHEATVWLEPSSPGPTGQHVERVTMGELLEAAASGQGHPFFEYDCWVVVYVPHYPLLEVCRLLPPERVIVEYPGVTPTAFHPPEDPFRRVLAGALDHLDMLDHVATVMVHSRYMQRELTSLRRLDEAKVRVLPLAVSEAFSPGPPFPPDGYPVVLYVGRLSGNKCVDDLVRVVALLLPRFPGLRLVVAGMHSRATTPTYRRRLDELADHLGVASAVTFLEDLSDEALADRYRAASLFVTASRHEGFCLPIAEAMSCGTPCVVVDGTACPETMGTGGMVCPPGAPADMAAVVARILGDPAERARLSAAALTESARFTQASYRRNLRALVDEVVSRPRRAVGNDVLAAAACEAPHYHDGLGWPMVGRFVRWLRRTVTLPLEVSCVRPMARQQTLWNKLMLQELRRLRAEVHDLRRRLRQEEP